MSIRIISIGKKHEPWVEAGLVRYQKRLKKPFDIEWVLLAHSSLEGADARQEESGRILARLPLAEYVILLDELGRNITSPALAEIFEDKFSHSHHVTIIIGGAYGVNDELQQRADFIWSLSKLVFPHQLVRLILVEQIYRAQEIAQGGKYHHS